MISIAKAYGIVLDSVRPLGTVKIPLAESSSYVLAEDIRADRDSPPADKAAMDGYAYAAKDISRSRNSLKVAFEVAAGAPVKRRIGPGSCARIMTGANVPAGADTVVQIEDTIEEKGTVTIDVIPEPGANVRLRGEEARRGDILLPKGSVLGPAQVGICAHVGTANPKVFRKPAVTILCTGEELREAYEKVSSHEIRNTNGPAIRAALEAAGFAGVEYQTVSDNLKSLISRLQKAVAQFDAILLTGGVSAGKYDYVPDAIKAVGAKIRFHKIAMKPGKPHLFATLSQNRFILGLPGNPLAALAGTHEFAIPALRHMSGYPRGECKKPLYMRLAAAVKMTTLRGLFVPVNIVSRKTGPVAVPVDWKGSGDLAAGARADGVVYVGKGKTRVPAGKTVPFTPWRALR